MVTHFDPNDLAKWTKAWAANPGKSLVYLQYGPSIPAYTKLAGKAANGIIWATVTGVYNDPVGKIFRDAYKAKFNASAGFSNSGSGYDGINMLARAWAITGDGQNFKANIAQLKKMIHRGVNGGYWLTKNAGLAFPAQTADPGVSQAHLFFQIQGGVHRIIQPAPYVEASYTKPVLDVAGGTESPEMTALACGGVRKTYGAFVALDDVAMTVDPGEILGLAGPNGAGKTTLFDVLSGRVRPDKGSVTLGDRTITSLSTHRRARLGLARTFQAPLVPTSLTVGETLRAARDAYRPSVTPDAVAHARELVRPRRRPTARSPAASTRSSAASCSWPGCCSDPPACC